MIYLELFCIDLPIRNADFDPIRNQRSSGTDDYQCVLEKVLKTSGF